MITAVYIRTNSGDEGLHLIDAPTPENVVDILKDNYSEDEWSNLCLGVYLVESSDPEWSNQVLDALEESLSDHFDND